MTPVPLYMDCRRGGKNRGKTVEKRCLALAFIQQVCLKLARTRFLLYQLLWFWSGNNQQKLKSYM